MTIRHITLRPWLASMAVVIFGSILLWQATLGFRAFTWESYRRLYVLQHPIQMPDIQLQDQEGRLFRPSEYKGKLILVNFIYTRCPTLCTYSGAVYGRLLKILVKNGRGAQVRLLSISLDPDYDTPVHLREYRSRYTAKASTLWRVARPLSNREGKSLLAKFGVISTPDGLGGIKHNAAIHLVDQQGRLVRIMNENDDVEILRVVNERLKSD